MSEQARRQGKKVYRFQLLEINNKVPLIHHKTSASTHFRFGNLFRSPAHHRMWRHMDCEELIGIAHSTYIGEWESKEQSAKKNRTNKLKKIDISETEINPNHTHIQLTFVYFALLFVYIRLSWCLFYLFSKNFPLKYLMHWRVRTPLAQCNSSSGSSNINWKRSINFRDYIDI